MVPFSLQDYEIPCKIMKWYVKDLTESPDFKAKLELYGIGTYILECLFCVCVKRILTI